MDYSFFFVLVPRVYLLLFFFYGAFSSISHSFILLEFLESILQIYPFFYLPHTICTIRAFALNVRTSGVSATSADPRRLEPLIHRMTSIPIERGSSEPQSSLLFLFYSHIGAIVNGPLSPLYLHTPYLLSV